MRLGVIGPAGSVKEACAVIETMGTPVELVRLPYSTYIQVVEILEREQRGLDAVLFTGEVPYKYAVRHIREERPWGFTPKDELSLAFTLLKAGYSKKYDITKISVDNISPQLLYQAYHQLGYEKQQIQVL